MGSGKRIIAAVIAGAAVAGIAAAVVRPQLVGAPGTPPNIDRDPTAAPGGPFSLVDHTGKRVSDADFRGRFLIVVFGYTFCPDVCPTTLNDVGTVMEMLGEKAQRVVPLFITVDPQRDTPAVLAEYVDAFKAGIIGLTGSPEDVDRTAQAYRVHYARSNRSADDDDAGYLVDHSAYTYLMGPDGRYLNHFAYGMPPERIAREILRRIDGES